MEATQEKYTFEPVINSKDHDPVKTGIASIDNLNLHRLIAKANSPSHGLNWDIEFCFQISDLYRIFLFLCLKHPTKIILPPREVDEFWHLHILDTRNYTNDCQLIFGEYLHHFPCAGLTGTPMSEEDEHTAIMGTLELVAQYFPDFVEMDDAV